MSFIATQLAQRLGAAGRIEEAEDKAVTTRPSSTALLSVDSLDRVNSSVVSSGDFLINKSNSIFNGFFNRIALNEIVLEWCIPNISAGHGNNVFAVSNVGGGGGPNYSVTLPPGFYTAAQVIDYVLAELNVLAGAGTFRLEDLNGNPYVAGTSVGAVCLATTGGGTFEVDNTPLAVQLSMDVVNTGNSFPIGCPKILPIYYLDFVSPQLTYNQDLKDNTTSEIVRDVLYRWVLAYDNDPIPLDKYNYPILQGYRSFISRRYLNYPKQILWNPSQPVGQLGFQVYDQNGDLVIATDYAGDMEYQLSLLFSEN